MPFVFHHITLTDTWCAFVSMYLIKLNSDALSSFFFFLFIGYIYILTTHLPHGIIFLVGIYDQFFSHSLPIWVFSRFKQRLLIFFSRGFLLKKQPTDDWEYLTIIDKKKEIWVVFTDMLPCLMILPD